MSITLENNKTPKVIIIGHPNNDSILAMELAHKLANDLTIPIIVNQNHLNDKFLPTDEPQRGIILTPKKLIKSHHFLVSEIKSDSKEKFETPKSKFHK